MDAVQQRAPFGQSLTSATAPAAATWLDVVLRFVRNLSMSRADREVLVLLTDATSRVGAPLLAATSLRDFQDRVETAALSPELSHFSAEAAKKLTFDVYAKAIKRKSEADPEIIDALGDGPANVVAEAWPLLAAELSVLTKLIAAEAAEVAFQPDRGTAATAAAFADDGALGALVYDASVPSEVRLVMLERLESGAALLGICYAMIHEAHVEPWLARALAEKFRDGLKVSLRFWAAFPNMVSESVVPAADRMNFDAIMSRHQEAEARIRALVERADTIPGGVLDLGNADDDL